jgi:hypothetical protein
MDDSACPRTIVPDESRSASLAPLLPLEKRPSVEYTELWPWRRLESTLD